MPEATVVATYSRRMTLRLSSGREIDARIKGKKLKPVCGDRVVADAIEGEDDWLITAIKPRSNELTRPNLRGKAEVLAANVDLLVVVAAATPRADWFIVDRYLCAAELMRTDAAVVFNKSDAGQPDDAAWSVYGSLGYTTLVTSAETGDNVAALGHVMAGRTSIVVGQSGVGKSSLINSLTGVERQKTAAISAKHREGKHTTVNSVMIPLADGGNVIDSPGVRDYSPALLSSSDAAAGFREVAAAAGHCRFANCRHMQEPGCAVKAGVDEGSIDARRYESYRRIVITTERLTEGRY